MGRCRTLPFTLAVIVVTVLAARVRAGAPDQPEPQKYQVEVRLMFWADGAERQSLAGQQGAIDDWFVRRARVVVQGRPSPSITFSLQVGQDNIGSKLLTDDGSPHVKDAYINYRAANAFQVTVGQFKIPFLRINLESGFNQLLVDRATLPSLRPAREGSRDLGAMAWGNKAGLQYRLAVFDGSDQEAKNTSSRLRLSSRVAYNWFAMEPGLAYTGTYVGKTRVLQIAAQADLQNSRLDPRDESSMQLRPRDYRAWALEAFFEQPLGGTSAFTVDGAWFDRRDDYVDAGLPTRTLRGFYAQSGFLLPGRIGPGRLQFALRRENWDTERDLVRTRTSRTAAGATYYLKDHSRKLQADYAHKRESPEIGNDEWRVSFALMF